MQTPRLVHLVMLVSSLGAVACKKDKTTEVEIPDATNEKGKRRVTVTAGIGNGSKTEILKGLNEGQQVILQ